MERSHKALGKCLFIAFSSLWWLQVILSLLMHHSTFCLHLHMDFSPVSLVKTHMDEFRAHPSLIQDELILGSLHLIIPAKTHFPNKVTHTSSRDEEVDISLGAPSHYSTQHLKNEQMNVRWHEVQGMPTQHFQF